MNRVRESAWHKQRKMKLTPPYLLHCPPTLLLTTYHIIPQAVI